MMRLTLIAVTGFLTLTAANVWARGMPFAPGRTTVAETWVSQTLPVQAVNNPAPPAKEEPRE